MFTGFWSAGGNLSRNRVHGDDPEPPEAAQGTPGSRHDSDIVRNLEQLREDAAPEMMLYATPPSLLRHNADTNLWLFCFTRSVT